MKLDHDAIRRAYPQAITIDDTYGALDKDGNKFDIDNAKVLEVLPLIREEKRVSFQKLKRAQAFKEEADPLYLKAQRGEATLEEWKAKVEEIRNRYPY